MNDFLYLIPALPFAGFIVLALLGRRLRKATVALVGAGSVGVSSLLAVLAGVGFVTEPPEGNAISQTLWTWMQFDGYAPAVSFILDPLSLVMVLVITVVGFLIHLYSAEFMLEEEGYSRFFAYMNLFV
ncbi:MAG TPA: NADH-quinone oxidoreductase subunit L, partial [Nitrospirota bacterium]|nr:NADH-quinone oxidoreductase subunit L [Nitrospirota bacterium]